MIPFDQDHDSSIVECIQLASLEQLGHELARRCADALLVAHAAKEAARTSDDLLTIASAADAAHQAADLCGHLSSAVFSLLGTGDVEVAKTCFAHARDASTHAHLAAARWKHMRDRHGAAHA